MKIIILLLSIVLFIHISAFAQREMSTDLTYPDSIPDPHTQSTNLYFEQDGSLFPSVELNKNTRETMDLWRLDSTINYSLTNEVDSVATRKSVYVYNNANNSIDFVTINFGGPTTGWVNDKRSLFTYNDANQQVEGINYNWSQGHWLGIMRSEYIYNENHQQFQSTYYTWDDVNQKWLNNARVEFGYNEQGLQDYMIHGGYDFETDEWVMREKNEIVYNEDGQEVLNTTFRRDINTSPWNNFEKTTFTYQEGLQSFEHFYWDSTEWKLFSKAQAYRIDSITTGHDSYQLQGDTMVMVTRYKSKTKEDTFGNEVFFESYGFSSLYPGWVGEKKYERFYNEQGQFLMVIAYQWVTDEEWIYKSKRQTGYNEYQIPFYTATRTWRVSENSWEKSTSATSYYSNITSINENNSDQTFLSVYPNPCNTQLTLDFNDLSKKVVQYDIYSVVGKKVNKGMLQLDNSNTIDVGNLSDGFYIIQLTVENQKYIVKFIKK
ncbi:MAG: T9SS type A sorting domain-containing protein [Bacteroidales bacterium]|jgi:hypothetical protein